VKTDADTPLVVLDGLRKSYNLGRPNEVEVLHGLALQLQRGEFAALIGPSGSGKSTLLNVLGLLEPPTAGSYRLLGQETAGLDDTALTRLRGQALGFVFQFHHLLPAFSALENVTLPMLMRDGRIDPAAETRARDLLDAMGLGDALHRKPGELSGGMQQRVAIARALAARPPLVLADEPTGNLDRHTADEVFGLMRQLHRELGTAFLVVTHDPSIAARCDRVVELVDGRIVDDRRQPKP
jgi:lipoprotein-releasing system ATP-binding protein